MKIQFKTFDYIIAAVIIVLVILAAIIFAGKSKIAKTPVLSENTVVFQVLFRGASLTSDEPVFKPMDDSFITIRNVPHKKVTIIGATQIPRLTTVVDAKGNEKVVKDAANPFMFDCLVTLYDEGKLTDDGVVVGGNKLKIGLPIVLEGKNYRLTGSLTNLKVLNAEEAEILKKAVFDERTRLEQNTTSSEGQSPAQNALPSAQPAQ